MEKAERIFVPLSRIALGLLFLIAGIQKVGDPELFAREISNYRLLPTELSSLSALAVPWLEILLGVLLISGLLTRAASLLAGCLSAGFAVFVSSALLRGLDVDCGCFTGESTVTWWHVALNLLMLSAAALSAHIGGGTLSLDRRWGDSLSENSSSKKTAGLVAVLLFLFNLGYLGLYGVPRLEIYRVSESLKNPPQVVFEKPFIDLGLVKQEVKTQVKISYKNIGTSEAVISKVESTCGCTNAKLGKSHLLPGESAELTVTYSAGPNIGRFGQRVRLLVDGQKEPTVLAVQGEVDPLVSAIPGLLEMRKGKSVLVKLQSRRNGFTPKVEGLSSTLPMIHLEKVQQATDGGVSVRLSADDNIPRPPGQSSAWPVHIKLENGPPCPVYIKPGE